MLRDFNLPHTVIVMCLLLCCSACTATETQKKGLVVNSNPTQLYSYKIINQYFHDTSAFTQGLLFYQGRLFESTGLYGHSTLREVDLATGKVIRLVRLPKRVFGEGLVLWKDKLIQLTWRAGVALVFDLKSFKLIKQFRYSTEGWGLTHNGEHLIMSDGSSTLYFRHPETFEVVHALEVTDQEVPITKLNELEFIKGKIYANVWMEDRIARISPETGQVEAWVDLTGLPKNTNPADKQAGSVLNGIAYDAVSDRIYITGKRWGTLYELQFVSTQPVN